MMSTSPSCIIYAANTYSTAQREAGYSPEQAKICGRMEKKGEILPMTVEALENRTLWSF